MTEGTAPSGRIPNEIFVRILMSCDSRTILRFAATCKRNLDLVTNSTELQLSIELEANGLEIIGGPSNGNPAYPTILEELRRYRDAWLDLDLGPSVTQHVGTTGVLCDNSYIHAFSSSPGGELLDGGELFDSLQIAPLDSSNPPPPPVNFHCSFFDFTVDLRQELAVLIGEPPQQNPTCARIQLCSTTTGLPHPLAAQPVLIAEVGVVSRRWVPATDFHVMESLLLTKFDVNMSYSYEVLIWDWVEGTLLHRIGSASGVCDTAFLDRNHLVLSSTVCDKPSERFHSISLLIFDIYTFPFNHRPRQSDGHFEISSYPTSKPILKLDFPKLRSDLSISPPRSRLKSAPVPGHAIYTGSVAFGCSHALTLGMLFSLVKFSPNSGALAYGRDPMPYANHKLSISGDHLLKHIERRKPEGCTTTTTLYWDDWGENATRWFLVGGSEPEGEWTSRVSGSRFVNIIHHIGRTDQTISVVDFNTSNIRRHSNRSSNLCCSPSRSAAERKAFNKEVLKGGLASAPKFSTGASDTSKIPPEIISLADTVESETKTTMWRGFEQPVVSRLPYRIVKKVREVPGNIEWRMDGSHIVGLEALGRRPEPLSVYKLQV